MTRLAVAILVGCTICLSPATLPAGGGVILEQTPEVTYGAEGTRVSLARLDALGASVVAVVPFIWQRDPTARDPVPGGSVSAEQIRAGVRAAKRAGLTVAVKPHVWVPGTWAGAVNPGEGTAWDAWFNAYADALVDYARAAEAAGADVFFVGTELRRSLAHTDAWRGVIRRVRKAFGGRVAYAAHGLDDLDRVGFVDELDILGVTLYPSLDDGAADTIRGIANKLVDRARNHEAAIWVAELGLRSAEGSLARPWESPAERSAAVDTLVQARILAMWLTALDRPEIETTLIYRWFTDPAKGGDLDTDFTPQNKPAEGVLLCAWQRICAPGDARIPQPE